MLQRRFIYALTGQTGHGKTAIALLLFRQSRRLTQTPRSQATRSRKGAASIWLVKTPTIYGCASLGPTPCLRLDGSADRASYIPGVFNIGQMHDRRVTETRKLEGVDIVIVDTSAAYFLGADENVLRVVTTLPGRPCVVVLCHRIKHAMDATQLLPRGGGAFLGEIDGNLTAWKHDETLVELSYTKLRGPGFEPVTFRLEKVTTPKLVDAKGRMLPTVRAVAISEAEQAAQTKHASQRRRSGAGGAALRSHILNR